MSNIYIELELFLDPAITEEAALKAELNRKIADWNKKIVSNPKFSSKVAFARKYIADGMRNSQDEAATARNQKLEELRFAIREQLMMGKITDRGFTRLCELFPCFTEATIKQESGFVPEQLFRPPAKPASLQCNRAIPAIEMESIQNDLLVVENGKYGDLYALLGGTNDTPRKTLHAKAEEELEKNRRVAVKSAEVNAKNRLYGKALNFFKDDYGQLDYDTALTRAVFDQLSRKKFQHRAVNGIITMAIHKQSVKDACEAGLTSAEAEWLVYEYYCEKMKCPPPIEIENTADPLQRPLNWIRFLKDAWAELKTPTVKQTVIQQTVIQQPAPVSSNPSHTSSQPEAQRAISVEEPTILLETFKVGDVKNTVNPFDQYTLETTIKDKVFWQASVLCALPLLIVSLDNDKKQLSDLLIPLFWLVCTVGFLYIVGRMFQQLILRKTEDIRLPIAGFFFTLFIGVPLMLFVGSQFLSITVENPTWALIYHVVTGGIMEEVIKILPVLFCILYFRAKTSLKLAFAIGFLSSVGLFAAKILLAAPWFQGFLFSNMKDWLPIFLMEIKDIFDGSSNDILVNAFPIFSLLIAHTVWTAIFTYYLFCAAKAGTKGIPFALIGLAVAVLLHIIYVMLCHNSLEGLAAFVVAGSFVLFYGYLTQVRRQIIKPA